jgi:hypothetical protein
MREKAVIIVDNSRRRQASLLRNMVRASVLLLCLLLSPVAAAWACGMPLDALIPSEQALIIFRDGRQELIPSLHLQSDQPGAAVIFPLPAAASITEGPDNTLFDYLNEVTQPEIKEVERLVWRDTEGMVGSAPGGVHVVEHTTIGGYSVAQLEADDVDALQQWFDENNYSVPANATPILQSYIDDGWTFVAIKLADNQQSDGALKPLRITFDTPELIYPMRLSALSEQALDVQLYVLAEQRVEIDPLETLYAGPVSDLDQPPPAEFAELFQASYLTKLRNTHINPSTITDDYVVRPAASNEPFRQVIERTIYINGWNRMALPILGIAAVVFCSSLALGIAYNIRRRIDILAGPDPEDEDDY